MDSEVPKPCRHFIGREEELDELHTLFEENRHIFLYGIAGIGKASLLKPMQSNTENSTPIFSIWNTPVIYIKIL